MDRGPFRPFIFFSLTILMMILHVTWSSRRRREKMTETPPFSISLAPSEEAVGKWFRTRSTVDDLRRLPHGVPSSCSSSSSPFTVVVYTKKKKEKKPDPISKLLPLPIAQQPMYLFSGTDAVFRVVKRAKFFFFFFLAAE